VGRGEERVVQRASCEKVTSLVQEDQMTRQEDERLVWNTAYAAAFVAELYKFGGDQIYYYGLPHRSSECRQAAKSVADAALKAWRLDVL
jgi:hypothetical protein